MDIQLPSWAQVILALSGSLGGIGGLIAVIRQWRRDKWEGEHAGKRVDADVTSSLTSAAVTLVNELEERVARLHDRIETLENQKDKLTCRIECLENENKDLSVEISLMREVIKERDERISELEAENKLLKDEVARLEARVKELENGRATNT